MGNGAGIFLIIVIVLIVAIAFTTFGRSRRSSGIGSHPVDSGQQSAPGASSSSEADHDQSEKEPADFGTK